LRVNNPLEYNTGLGQFILPLSSLEVGTVLTMARKDLENAAVDFGEFSVNVA
jgi:hypothetical protein